MVFEDLLWQPVNYYVGNFNISRMFKDVSNAKRNVMFMRTMAFEIAGRGLGQPHPWYKVLVPKGLVQEG